jgi:hypothetical protein
MVGPFGLLDDNVSQVRMTGIRGLYIDRAPCTSTLVIIANQRQLHFVRHSLIPIPWHMRILQPSFSTVGRAGVQYRPFIRHRAGYHAHRSLRMAPSALDYKSSPSTKGWKPLDVSIFNTLHVPACPNGTVPRHCCLKKFGFKPNTAPKDSISGTARDHVSPVLVYRGTLESSIERQVPVLRYISNHGYRKV